MLGSELFSWTLGRSHENEWVGGCWFSLCLRTLGILNSHDSLHSNFKNLLKFQLFLLTNFYGDHFYPGSVKVIPIHVCSSQGTCLLLDFSLPVCLENFAICYVLQKLWFCMLPVLFSFLHHEWCSLAVFFVLSENRTHLSQLR